MLYKYSMPLRAQNEFVTAAFSRTSPMKGVPSIQRLSRVRGGKLVDCQMVRAIKSAGVHLLRPGIHLASVSEYKEWISDVVYSISLIANSPLFLQRQS